MKQKLNEIWIVFLEQLKADKKRAAVLAVLSVVFVVVAIRQLAASGSPDSAEALTVATPAPVVADDGLIRPSDEPAATSDTVPEATSSTDDDEEENDLDHVTDAALGRRAVKIDRFPRRLERDPFRTREWSRFPLAANLIEMSPGTEKKKIRTTLWSQMGAMVFDYQSGRADRIEQMETDLAALELQSTMTGPVPMAYISGRLIQEGDQISGFLVRRIEDRRVVLRRDGIERSLKLR